MSRTSVEVVREYLAAQSRGDVAEASRWIASDAVFDVGRGRYEGAEVRDFLNRLRTVNSVTSIVDVEERGEREVVGVLEQRDDDLAPLGIDRILLDVEIDVLDEKIARFTARPTPESLAAIAAARAAGRRSEGVDLAESAGTLPPRED